MEVRGIESRAFHMQSERSTTELHPHTLCISGYMFFKYLSLTPAGKESRGMRPYADRVSSKE